MKLRITPAQFSALSPAAACTLGAYLRETHSLSLTDDLPLLTIGDMIAFLVDHQRPDERHSYIDDSDYDVVLCTQTDAYRVPNKFDLGWRGDLCDALWARTQEVLEERDGTL